jgi:hypothetical protein
MIRKQGARTNEKFQKIPGVMCPVARRSGSHEERDPCSMRLVALLDGLEDTFSSPMAARDEPMIGNTSKQKEYALQFTHEHCWLFWETETPRQYLLEEKSSDGCRFLKTGSLRRSH